METILTEEEDKKLQRIKYQQRVYYGELKTLSVYNARELDNCVRIIEYGYRLLLEGFSNIKECGVCKGLGVTNSKTGYDNCPLCKGYGLVVK